MMSTGSPLEAEDIARRIGELQQVIEAQQKRAHQHLHDDKTLILIAIK